MFAAFANAFKVKAIRNRILFTIAILVLCRVFANVATPGVDASALAEVFEKQQNSGGVMNWLDLFSGGALRKVAIGTLSIWPYISASIVLQLLTAIIPQLERLAREGDTGRQKLNQYTRYLTVVICVFQSALLAISLMKPAALGMQGLTLVQNPSVGFVVLTVLTMTASTLFLMWLGEQITSHGIGNGISVIIAANICSRLPAAAYQFVGMFKGSSDGGEAQFSVFTLILLISLLLAVVMGTVALTQGIRKIPIHTVKRSGGQSTAGGQHTYMPLRVNYTGVMPIIFAGPMLALPGALLKHVDSEALGGSLRWIGNNLQPGETLYTACFAIVILFFAFFWVATQFNPLQIADDLKRSGGYVPGIRPGKPTADFLDSTMTRITLIGATGLIIVAILPSALQAWMDVPVLVSSFFGGTSVLIVVGVTLDTMRQLESLLVMRHYDGFLKHGRVQGPRNS